MEFWPCCFKHWNCDLILPIIGILVLLCRTLELWPYPYKHCTSVLIFPNVGILALFYILWKTFLILPNTGILAHFYEHCSSHRSEFHLAMFLDFWRYTTHSRGFTLVCCIDGIQHFREFRLFIKKYNVWSQSSGVQGRAINLSSYAKYLVEVVCKSIEKLSFLLY